MSGRDAYWHPGPVARTPHPGTPFNFVWTGSFLPIPLDSYPRAPSEALGSGRGGPVTSLYHSVARAGHCGGSEELLPLQMREQVLQTILRRVFIAVMDDATLRTVPLPHIRWNTILMHVRAFGARPCRASFIQYEEQLPALLPDPLQGSPELADPSSAAQGSIGLLAHTRITVTGCPVAHSDRVVAVPAAGLPAHPLLGARFLDARLLHAPDHDAETSAAPSP